MRYFWQSHKNPTFLPPRRGKVGHYTQLVWAETTKIGCGFIEREDPEPEEEKYRFRKVERRVPDKDQWGEMELSYQFQTLVCNYGIGGNTKGLNIYEIARG